jgi:thiol-disulfide isomerase/thioredoxin
MSRNLRTSTVRLLAVPFVGLFVTAMLAGCGGEQEGPVSASSSNYEVADESPTDGEPSETPPVADAGGAEPDTAVPTPPTMPPMSGEQGVDPLQVPEGGEAELLAFLESLQSYQPQVRTQQEFMNELIKLSQAQVTAADKLLATTQNDKVRLTATQAKLEAMRMICRVTPDPQLTQQLTDYCRTVVADENQDVALLGRLMLFGLATDALMTGQATDVEPVLEELKQLLVDNPEGEGVFEVVAQAAQTFQGMQEVAATSDAFEAIVAAYKNSENPEIASQARALELNIKIPALLAGEAGSVEAVMGNLKELLGGDILDPTVLNMTSQVGQMLELTGNYQQAGEAFAMIENAFKDNADPSLAAQAAERAAYGSKRASLFGQPFVVEGVLLDGSAFDWSAYAGKVVLVDFWATWCGPCLEELPNIVAAYEKYKDKGFEVVGVNLDDDVQSVQAFLEPQPLPWKTVVAADPNARGFENPMAVKCGVDAIPFLVLVNQEGKVEALHVRGEMLEAKLAEMLGPVEEPVEPAPSIQPAPTLDGPPAAPAAPTVPGTQGEPVAPATPPGPPLTPPE